MPARITVVVTGAHIELRVSYDGRQPPLELFSMWSDLGWQPPTPAMPPRSAIDWDTPDQETGRAFSIQSWDATGVATLPHPSTDGAKRVAGALEAARRLGYQVIVDDRETTPESSPPTPLDGPEPGARVHITAVLLAHAAGPLVAGARSRGATVVVREISISRTVRYRGSTNVTQTPAVEVEIDITESEVAAIVSALTPHATSAPKVDRVE